MFLMWIFSLAKMASLDVFKVVVGFNGFGKETIMKYSTSINDAIPIFYLKSNCYFNATKFCKQINLKLFKTFEDWRDMQIIKNIYQALENQREQPEWKAEDCDVYIHPSLVCHLVAYFDASLLAGIFQKFHQTILNRHALTYQEHNPSPSTKTFCFVDTNSGA